MYISLAFLALFSRIQWTSGCSMMLTRLRIIPRQVSGFVFITKLKMLFSLFLYHMPDKEKRNSIFTNLAKVSEKNRKIRVVDISLNTYSIKVIKFRVQPYQFCTSALVDSNKLSPCQPPRDLYWQVTFFAAVSCTLFQMLMHFLIRLFVRASE